MEAIYVSNMSKLCNSEEEARDFIDETTTSLGPTRYYVVIEEGEYKGKCVLYKNNGKVDKSNSYQKPDLSFINK